ncbi:MAG: hypothetical protein J6C20_07220 [Paludibacteraceae bacterium]|nr:hypothetical protein [Paludibacteraceae bacterium]
MENMDINIKKLIKITGEENSGKTTFAAELYKSLLAKKKPQTHQLAFWPKYIFEEVKTDDCIDCKFCQYIKYIKGKNKLKISSGKYVDFMSIMEYKNETVIFISEGDSYALTEKIEFLLKGSKPSKCYSYCKKDNNCEGDSKTVDCKKYNDGRVVTLTENTNIILICCIQDKIKKRFENYININIKECTSPKEYRLHSYETIAESISEEIE